MLTWRIDRILRSGPLCVVTTFIVPALLGILVSAVSSVENILALSLVASGIIGIGTLIGSVVASGCGIALFGIAAVLSEVPAWMLTIVGAVLFATFMVHDLAGSLHRAPRIGGRVWTLTAVTTGLIIGCASVAFALTFLVAKLATWQTIVVPFGIAALGFAIKLAADSHVQASRQLTAKRRKADKPDA